MLFPRVFCMYFQNIKKKNSPTFILLFYFNSIGTMPLMQKIIINNKKKTIPLEIVAVLPNSSSCSPLPLFWSTNMVISQNPNVEIGRGWRRIPFSERAFLTLWLACFLLTHHIHPSTHLSLLLVIGICTMCKSKQSAIGIIYTPKVNN